MANFLPKQASRICLKGISFKCAARNHQFAVTFCKVYWDIDDNWKECNLTLERSYWPIK